MKLTILGSGTFFVDKEVSASSFVLDTGSKKILIDCGPGTLSKLAQAGFKLGDLDYVFVTHFHPDHTSDLFPLFMNYNLSEVFTPGAVTNFPTFFGPEGLDKFLSDYSHLTELLAYDKWGKIPVHEYKPEIQLGSIKIKTFKVEHEAFGIQTRAYALRFEINGKVIVFSGDTQRCKGIEDACKDSDIFICDCSYPKGKGSTAHMDTKDIGEISDDGGVKTILLTHFYPQFSSYDFISEVKENFKGKVIKAKDLDIIEI